jgi:hypothetical protein
MDRFKTYFLPVLLVAAYPVLALYAYNIEAVDAISILRPLVITLAAGALLLMLFRLILRSWGKASLVASTTLIMFFSYGHLYGAAEQLNQSAISLGHHRIFAPLFLVIWILLFWLIARQKGDLRIANQTVTVIAGIALIFPLFSMGQFLVNRSHTASAATEEQSAHLASGAPKPDIYYIILDGYSRDDTLKDFFSYDNSSFLKALEDMGFYVARCSQSNYAQTQLSLSSSSNMNYLQSIDPIYADPANTSRAALPGMIRASAVRKFLEEQGYQIIGFDSGFSWTNLIDADFYLAPTVGSTKYMGMSGGANEFEVMLMETSAVQLLSDASIRVPKMLKPDLTGPRKLRRERILYTLEELPKIPRLPSPKFTFAHIVAPHSPYVFGPNGEPVDKNVEGALAYRDQLIYINKRVLPVLQQIIASSETPPIIILQADHGGVRTNLQDRMRILNAYYLPDGGEQILYPSISPVNTFRKILNYYFGTNYPQLDDTAYHSGYELPYDYTVVKDSRPGCP